MFISRDTKLRKNLRDVLAARLVAIQSFKQKYPSVVITHQWVRGHLTGQEEAYVELLSILDGELEILEPA